MPTAAPRPRSVRIRAALGAGLLALIATALVAAAPAPAAPLPGDLAQLPHPSLTFSGALQNESYGLPWNEGRPVAESCDLDGDGVDDLAVGALGYYWSVKDFTGRVFVTRGGSGLAGGTVTALPQTVEVTGFEDTKAFGTWTDCAGDFDGDGFDDLLVSSDSRGSAAEVPVVYVVRGGAGFFAASKLDVSATGAPVFAIEPPSGQTLDDGSAAAVGDADGDGKDDIAVILPWVGKVYFVPGRAASGGGGTIDPTAGREVLSGTRVYPTTLTGVGDLDGDGKRELVLSSSQHEAGKGRVSVISGAVLGAGAEPSFDVSTETPGERLLFRVSGEQGSYAGHAVAGVPDLNGDGRDELALGTPWPYGDPTNTPPRPLAGGEVHVVFGTSSHAAVDLAALGAGGYTITGPSENAELGYSLSASPDLDGDGLADLLIGAPVAQSPAMQPSTNGGAGYVIYGKADTAPVATTDLAADEGAVLYGTHFQNRLGLNVAAVGDVDGNGLPDLAFSGWTPNFTGKGQLRLVRPGELPVPPEPEAPVTPTTPVTPGGWGGPAPGNPPPPASKPALKRLGKKAKVSGKGIARVARVSCPAGGGNCKVAVPKQVTVKIGGESFRVKVLAPRRLAAGKSAVVRLKLTKPALEELGGAKLTIPAALRLA